MGNSGSGKERKSKEGAGTGETFTAEQRHKTLRPPDLCRKQKGEVVIMWSITMCRSEKSQHDFDMSVRKDQIQTLGFAC